LSQLGTDEEDEETRAFAEMMLAASNAQEDTSPETDMALQGLGKLDDKLLINSILEFNKALYMHGEAGELIVPKPANRESMQRANAELFINMRREMKANKRPKKVKPNPAYSLSTIKYVPRKGPAVLNVSTVEFQQLLQRFNMTNSTMMMSQSKSSPALLTNGGSEGGAETRSKNEIIAMLIQESERANKAAAAANSAAAAAHAAAAAALSEASPSASASSFLAPVPENSVLNSLPPRFDLLESLSNQPATTSDVAPRPSTTSGLLRPSSSSLLLRNASEGGVSGGNQIPTSPIIKSRPPSSSTSGAFLSQSLDLPSSSSLLSKGGNVDVSSIVLDPIWTTQQQQQQQPKSSARGVKPSTGSKGVSESRADMKMNRPGSSALAKLSISTATGTASGGHNKMDFTGPGPHSLSKARIKEIRTLRDSLMSTAGSFAMNVHPEASPDAQEEAAASVRITKEMVKETMDKNRVDQTWTLLTTPGYYEAVGPSKSDTQIGFAPSEKFDKAVREADVSQGIKRDPLRVWSEDGVKNKIKLFAAGGAMKI